MPEKKIDDLPQLSQDDFNAATDYILVQKPNGGTYKMITGHALADITSGNTYVDYKTTTMQDLKSGKIEFSASNLLNTNSAWNIMINFKLSALRASKHNVYGLTGLTINESRIFSLIKKEGENKINGKSIPGSFSYDLTSYKNSYSNTGRSKTSGTATVTYKLKVTSSNNKVRLDFTPSFTSKDNWNRTATDRESWDYRCQLGKIDCQTDIFGILKP